jgi:hypothetical protein
LEGFIVSCYQDINDVHTLTRIESVDSDGTNTTFTLTHEIPNNAEYISLHPFLFYAMYDFIFNSTEGWKDYTNIDSLTRYTNISSEK